MSSTPLRCVSSYHLLEREDVAGEDVAELRHGEDEVVWCWQRSLSQSEAGIRSGELL